MTAISVIGAGAWGTTIANILAGNGHDVTLWCYKESLAKSIHTEAKHHRLPGVKLDPNIKTTTHFDDCYASDFVVLGFSSKQLIEYEHQLVWQKMTKIALIAKGVIEPNLFISDWIASRFSGEVALISGPNLALEIAQKKPAATVVASTHHEFAQQIQKCLSNSYFRVYTSTDLRGVECGGIFKNIFAIAAGCLDALDYGQNAKAALITRGLLELERLFAFFGASRSTLMGLSGLGDLIATCSSSQSRNWQLGYEVIQNPNRNEWEKSNRGETEGVRTIRLIHSKIIEESLDLPIILSIGRLFFEHDVSPKKIIQDLMERGLKSEFDQLI
ncbi:MAG: NAD(P)H-dependent glycerol-3-phosphate dehydrogenase [Candidatus Margulisiibacteriota bacterium]